LIAGDRKGDILKILKKLTIRKIQAYWKCNPKLPIFLSKVPDLSEGIEHSLIDRARYLQTGVQRPLSF